MLGLNRQLESDKEELVEMIESRCRGGTTNGPLHNKLEVPTFGGAAYDKPKKYLNDLLQYFNAGNVTQWMFKHIVRRKKTQFQNALYWTILVQADPGQD